MAVYKVRAAATGAGADRSASRHRRSPIVIAVMLVLVAVPLTTSSLLLVQQRARENDVLAVSRSWAEDYGWEVLLISSREGSTVVRLAGPLPIPEPESLRAALAAGGVDVSTVRAEFIPIERVDFGEPTE
jgi:hypothetical protein